MKLETILKIVNQYRDHNNSDIIDNMVDSIKLFDSLESDKTSSIFDIREEHGFIPDIDNVKLSEEVLSSAVRISDDHTNSRFEDTIIQISDDSEAIKALNFMRNIAISKGLDLYEWWSQIHHPLESTDIHRHYSNRVDLQLSWVYYVKVPEGAGSIVFIVDERADTKEIKPEVGKYIIFPSWLAHKVTKNLSSDIRVSMSGNFIKY